MLKEEHSETIIGGVCYKVTSIYTEGKKDFQSLYQNIIVDRVLRHIEQQNSIGQDSTIVQVIFSVLASAASIAATVALLTSQIGGR